MLMVGTQTTTVTAQFTQDTNMVEDDSVNTHETFVLVGGVEYDKEDYTVPLERTFRSAWSKQDTVITVDMSKAKDVWRDKIRRKRKKVFEELDNAFMIALEKGEDTSQIAADKQALRDAPADPAIDAAKTPEQLKLVQPIKGVTIE
jgi:hypothetical protein